MFSHHDMVHHKKQSQLYQVNCSFSEQQPFDFGLAPFPLWLVWAWVLALDPLRASIWFFFVPLYVHILLVFKHEVQMSFWLPLHYLAHDLSNVATWHFFMLFPK
jgi:hypothetical protein